MREGTQLKPQHIHVIFNEGGMGDAVCRMAACNYVAQHYPHVRIGVWVPDYFVKFAGLVAHPRLEIRPFSNIQSWREPVKVIKTDIPEHTLIRNHLIDQSFNLIVDMHVPDKDKNYPVFRAHEVDTDFLKLPEKFVVVTTGFTAPVRELTASNVNGIVDYIIANGYEVVFLGSSSSKNGAKKELDIKGNFSDEIDYSKGRNYIDKTHLHLSAAIIAKSSGIVGLDNGLLHVAGCTDVPIVAGFTTVDPDQRLPIRHGIRGWNCYPVVPKDLDCRFCQSRMNFVYDHDFRNCYYGDYKCVKMDMVEEYKAQLNKAIFDIGR